MCDCHTYSIELNVEGAETVTTTNNTGITTNASTNVSIDSTQNLAVGMEVSGTGIPNNATIASITNATTFVLSAAATGGPITLSCSTVNTSGTVTTTSTANLLIGMTVTGNDIPANTTVSSITNATTLEISNAASATGSGVTLTFSRQLTFKQINPSLSVEDTYTIDVQSLLPQVVGKVARYKWTDIYIDTYDSDNVAGDLIITDFGQVNTRYAAFRCNLGTANGIKSNGSAFTFLAPLSLNNNFQVLSGNTVTNAWAVYRNEGSATRKCVIPATLEIQLTTDQNGVVPNTKRNGFRIVLDFILE
jgi:hypothetical protein